MIKKLYYKIRYKNVIDLVAKSTDKGRDAAYKLIIKYRKIFEYIYGRDFVYEVILNYRVHYHNKKDKIFNMYKKYILPKKKIYISDVVISMNIINKFNPSSINKNMIEEVLTKYFGQYPYTILKIKARILMEEQKNKR